MTPQLAFRVAVLGLLAVGVFAVLFLRLWALQVLSTTKYRVAATSNRVRTTEIEGPRGTILDRSGHVLVRNTVATSLELWPADLPKQASARLREVRAISAVAGVPYAQILVQMRQHAADPLTPVVLGRVIHAVQISYVSEHQFEFPGVEMVDNYVRNYPYGSLAAQILGYVGPISQAELSAATRLGYQPQDVMGQAGIEASYDQYLRGTNGSAEVTVDSLGRPTGPVQTTVLPEPGSTLRLTLDIGLQKAAEVALREGISLARQSSFGTYADGGAIVALDPRDGAVLALASNPTYAPSAYITRSPAKLAPLENQQVAATANFPGLDRAIDVSYPPGSVFKPVTALAAMEENILSPTEMIPCTPSFTYYKQLFTNWDPNVDQLMALPQALAESCDTYFYRVGARFYNMPGSLGPVLQLWASRFGFGAPTGIDVGPEQPGLVPTPDWRCRAYGGPPCQGYINRIWKPGYEVQLAIGQGDLLVTPIQMARFYAMIANGGELVKPHLAEDVELPGTSGGQPQIVRDLATQQPTPSGVSPAALGQVQAGLYEGTHSPLGTSFGVFGHFPVPVAGKTGTAQKLISIPGYQHPLELNQSWWCGYGPYAHPTLVVCAVIENGGYGGSAAAPAALKVFEQYFHKQATTTAHISD